MGFRENLREALDFSGLEQKELAYKAKISLSSIENYLRKNGAIPTAENAVRIAQALGVSVEYLVTGKNLPVENMVSSDPEVHALLRQIKKLPRTKQRILVQIAQNIAEILSKSQSLSN